METFSNSTSIMTEDGLLTSSEVELMETCVLQTDEFWIQRQLLTSSEVELMETKGTLLSGMPWRKASDFLGS